MSHNGREHTRVKVRERDNHSCQNCGKKKKKNGRALDVHHLNGECGKKSRKYDKVSEMNGLITLCHKCHYNRHDRSEKLNNFNHNRPRINIKRDLEIIKLRKERYKLHEIGEKYGISRERVRQICL